MIQKTANRKSSHASRPAAKMSGLQPIKLPKPRPGRSTSVFTALQKRQTIRSIKNKRLPLQVLSNLLWAACGINRKAGPFGVPGSTAASASNSQEIEVYVAKSEALYLYEPHSHMLVPVVEKDLRVLAIGEGQKSWGSKAPVRLIYVADLHRFSMAGYLEPGLWDPEIQKSYYFVDTGIIAANMYLFAASQGLGCWFHNCNKAVLATQIKLRPGQRILFGQTIGYPAQKKPD
jgi:nitroreductase